MDVLSKMYLAVGDLDRRLDHLEFLVVQTIRLLDHYPDIEYVTDSDSYKQLESDITRKVYGKAQD